MSNPTKVTENKTIKTTTLEFMKENCWEKWKTYVSNFYKSYRVNKVQVSPLFIKQPFDNRPYLEINIFGYIFTALLDSGATQSVLGSKALHILNKFSLILDKNCEKKIHTADGTPQVVSGCIYLPIHAGDVCNILKVLVVPSLDHSIILGSDFCKLFMIEIDFKNDFWNVNSKLTNCILNVNSELTPVLFPSLCSFDNFNLEQKARVQNIIDSFNEISLDNRLGRTNKLALEIDTAEAKPIKVRQYPLSPYMMKILNSELDEMLRLGVVEPSHSSWNSPVLLVKKKSGEYRFCFDGRRLNSVTKPDAYPLPRVDRILSMLRDARFISSIDLKKAFWQIPLHKDSKEKTAFSIPGRGLYHFNVVPFGLVNSAQCQQRLMDAIFGPKFEPHVFCYLDDIIVTSSSFNQHVEILTEVLDRLREANLTVNLNKCEFFKSSLKYLGFVVDSEGLKTDPDKISAMVNYPRPANTTEIKRFIGMTSWYRRFINNFSTLVSPLNGLLKGRKKGQNITWNFEAEKSFIKLKQALISTPILRSPDFTQPFIIQCDASDSGLGGILLQKYNNEEYVIAFASRSLSKSERNYSVTERESLSVVFSIDKFRPFVEGTHFTVITDHYSLLWLNNLKEPTGKLARWPVKLQQFSFDLIHRKGSLNVVPDAFSRIPSCKSADPKILLLHVSLDQLDSFYVRIRDNILKEPSRYPNWRVTDGYVYKHISCRIPLRSNINEWKILVPKCQRKQIISACHDPPTSGHFGYFKTLSRIQERYYWPKLRNDVLKYVKSCHICASQKISSDGKMGLMGSEKKVNFPFQILAVDILGPLPRSSKGFSHLL